MGFKLFSFDTLVFPLLVPFILAWLALARLLSMLAPLLIFPSFVFLPPLYRALPFLRGVWRQRGPSGLFMKLGFDANYLMNITRRLLTLPLRRATPDFYIVGFPKAGTTSLANYLREHPAISGMDGMPWHDVLQKESHFFNGALGRGWAARSRTMYRSYFPTLLTRWWAECVNGVDKWLCFDACPIPSCLDFTAARIAAMSPNAKLIFCLRDPCSAAFSAEIMLRDAFGSDLGWTLMADVKPNDPRFLETPQEAAYWKKVAQLAPEEDLPAELMVRFYASCPAILRCGKYADRILPFLKHFPREKMLFIEFEHFCSRPKEVLDHVFRFVGADPARYKFQELPPGMSGARRGRHIHPSVKAKLAHFYRQSNLRLYAILGRDFDWAGDVESPAKRSSSASASTGEDLPVSSQVAEHSQA